MINKTSYLYPLIAAEWDHERNGGKEPDDFLPQSNYYAHWVCERGHRWQARINNRTNKQSQCPYCAGIRPISGETDLASLYPLVAVEWHPDKNGDLKPSDVTAKSNQKVWWLCSNCGYEWQAKVYHRTDGRSCPVCAGLIVIPGKNDLMTLHPGLSLEWAEEKNAPLTPGLISAGSSKRVWWKCPVCGFLWQTTVQKRTKHYSGCPVCSGKACGSGINDIMTLAPELAAEWDSEKNAGILPQEVALHSNQKRFWKCEAGHKWSASPNNRSKGEGCPYCAGKSLLPNINSLAKLKPELSKEWNYEKNSTLTPSDVAAYDNRLYWWRCKEGHEWQASPSNRSNGKGCPYCKRKKPIQGKNDFATFHPEIAIEWHPERNQPFTPDMFFPSNIQKRWWLCEQGHVWATSIAARVRGVTCPICCKRRKPFQYRGW